MRVLLSIRYRPLSIAASATLASLTAQLMALATAQQQMFRYVDKDGRTVYTDKAPPADARSVQQKKLGGNYIETSEPPYSPSRVKALRNSWPRYPWQCLRSTK